MLHALLPVLFAALPPQQPDLDKLVGDAKVPMAKAIAIALRTARTGTATQAELEFEHDRAVWSVDVAQGTKVCEVLVDAKDGSVLETGEEAEDCSAVVQAADLTLTQAVAAVLAQHRGTAVLAQLQLVQGKQQVTVEVFAAGKKSSFVADAPPIRETGKPPQDRRGEEDEKAEGLAKASHGEPAKQPPAAGEEREGARKPEAQAGSGPGRTSVRQQTKARFTDAFGEEPGDLGPTGTNPYFVLEPGYTLVLEGQEDGEDTRIVIKVLDETRTIDGIEARVVEEREDAGGRPKEITRDYFAISERTNNVYYLGEDVDNYVDGHVASHTGSWLHGKDGARYGLMMPGSPLLGARYQQEVAPGVAMDRAEIEALSGTFECAAGKFEGVLAIEESTPLEPGSERKLYARGVGLVQDGALRLVRYGRARTR